MSCRAEGIDMHALYVYLENPCRLTRVDHQRMVVFVFSQLLEIDAKAIRELNVTK